MRTVPGLALLCLAFALQAAPARAAPFDMSPERGPAPPSAAPRKVAPAPPARAPRPAPSPPARPEVPAASLPRQPSAPAPPREKAAGKAVPTGDGTEFNRRYLVPARDLTFYGEASAQTWSIDLTSAEAEAGTLHLGYENSIVVAPEASRLTLRLNGTPVLDRAVASPGGAAAISVPVPAGLLHAGTNSVQIETSLRHRTDCSVASTYQLWTRIDSSKTYLSFRPGTGGRYASLDDIKAVGVDGRGRTRFDIVVPALDQPAAGAPLFRLAEGLALHAGMPNQSFSVTETMPKAVGAGDLTVLMGTASELGGIVPALPEAAASSPVASFVPTSGGKDSVLVISGPSWSAVSAAVDNIVVPLDRPAGPREALLTDSWHAPNAPVLYGGDRVSFADLGVATTSDFSGRRYSTRFYFGIPSDFYASSYGHATILLDAAYSPAVEPGSRVNVYVNGRISSTYPISTEGGAILRHMPITVTMRDFRPGLNVISLEAILRTKSDRRCLPGATADRTPRFALFDTSEFLVPDFARIGQRPNLAALSGTGFPYNLTRGRIPLVMNSRNPDILSSTATFLARLAVAAGRPIPVSPTSDIAAVTDRDALFIGQIGEMQSTVLDQLAISDTVRSNWGEANGPVTDEAARTSEAFKAWRKRLHGGHWYGEISSLEDWLNRNFDISLASLRFAPKADENFVPARGTSLMISQASNPARNGTWTMISAPTARQLSAGVDAVTRELNWPDIAGHITTYDAGNGDMSVEPVSTFSFVGTRPASIANYRLIAANWLSSNALTYAALFGVISVALGVATSGLLSKLGRRR